MNLRDIDSATLWRMHAQATTEARRKAIAAELAWREGIS